MHGCRPEYLSSPDLLENIESGIGGGDTIHAMFTDCQLLLPLLSQDRAKFNVVTSLIWRTEQVREIEQEFDD